MVTCCISAEVEDALEPRELPGRRGDAGLSLPIPSLSGCAGDGGVHTGGTPSQGERRVGVSLLCRRAATHREGRHRTGLRAGNLSPWKGSKHLTSFN